MTVRHLIIASALALAGAAASAVEPTQFVDPPSMLSRASVVAELQAARASGEWVTLREGDQRDMPVTASLRSRAEVRAEARTAAREHRFDPLYVGA